VTKVTSVVWARSHKRCKRADRDVAQVDLPSTLLRGRANPALLDWRSVIVFEDLALYRLTPIRQLRTVSGLCSLARTARYMVGRLVLAATSKREREYFGPDRFSTEMPFLANDCFASK
jgi:hypothetical protein